jgi:hypothetical protein
VPFSAEPEEPFNAERHQLIDGEGKPSADAGIAETAAPGFTFQGRLLRPALVRLRQTNPPEGNPAGETAASESAAANPPEGENSEEQLPLGAE